MIVTLYGICNDSYIVWYVYISVNINKQITDISKYCLVNRKIKMWNQLPVEGPATFLCKSHILRQRVRKVTVSEEK